MSYAELLNHSLRLAAGFRDLGIKEGDAIGLSSENTMDFYPVVLATFFVGATIAPINPTYIESKLVVWRGGGLSNFRPRGVEIYSQCPHAALGPSIYLYQLDLM